MAKMTILKCDVCGEPAQLEDRNVFIVFTTEQTEGRSVEPYPQIQKLDFCEKCYSRLMQESPLRATGAQGYNTYTWREGRTA